MLGRKSVGFFVFVVFQCLIVSSVFADPRGVTPEGSRYANFVPPQGCTVTREYLDDESCKGESCFLPTINCCGNGNIDHIYYTANQSSRLLTVEECDQGILNGQKGQKCGLDCKIQPHCGDGLINTEEEECDGSRFLSRYSNFRNLSCSSQCTVNYCGDGRVNTNLEFCDDGNRNNYDDCSNYCEINTGCDAFVIQQYVEYGASAIGGDYEDLSCLVQKIEEWGGNASQLNGASNRADDNLIENFWAFIMNQAGEHYCLAKGYLEGGPDFNNCMLEQHGGWLTLRYNYVGKDYKIVDTYIDNDCRFIRNTETDGLEICGHITHGFFGSPISLIFDQDAYQSTPEWELRPFALNPARGIETVIWKASSAAPLLVWDPKRTGTVSSGAQLFGNYFGGKSPITKTALGSEPKASDFIWDNGYEALGSLDLNADAILAEEELKDLFLWFDHNTNAQVDSGEMTSLSEQGVTRLFTRYNSVDQNGDLHAKLGYERKVEEQVVFGSSVDWYTTAYSSGNEALGALSQKDQNVAEIDSAQLIAAAYSEPKSSFSGVWAWRGDKSIFNKIPTGVLVLDGQDQNIEGQSLIEEPIIVNGQPIKARIVSQPLAGQAVSFINGEDVVRFVVEAESGQTESEARLSNDRQSLLGRSFVQIADKTAPNGTRLVSYSWTARRIGPK